VARRDRSLQRVRTGAADRSPQGPLDERGSLGDLLCVPATPVLVLEQDELAAIVDACLTARVGHQEQREQAEHLGLVGEEAGEQLGEADGLVAEVDAHDVVTG